MKIILANITTLCVLKRSAHEFSDTIEFLKNYIEEKSILPTEIASDYLLNRFYPLAGVKDASHIEDVYRLNVLLMKVKFDGVNTQASEIDNLANR